MNSFTVRHFRTEIFLKKKSENQINSFLVKKVSICKKQTQKCYETNLKNINDLILAFLILFLGNLFFFLWVLQIKSICHSIDFLVNAALICTFLKSRNNI